MKESIDAQRPERHGVPLGISLSLIAVLAATISTIAFLLAGGEVRAPVLRPAQDEPEPLLVINTRTPTPSPTPTSTPPRTAAPTRAASATASASSTPMPTLTATAAATHTATHTPATADTPATPAPNSTPYAVVIGELVRLRAGPGQVYDVVGHVRQGDALPVVGRTANGEWVQLAASERLAWVLATLTEIRAGAGQIPVAPDIPPTPTATWTPSPTPTPPPTPLPVPVLSDPPNGAVLGDKVRFVFRWFRRLGKDERASIYVQSANGVDHLDWSVNEADILAGGGAIHAENDGVVYEVHSGLEPLPPGEAFWRIAIFRHMPSAKRQISPSSQERQILKK